VRTKGAILVPSAAQESRFLRVVTQIVTDRQNKSLNLKYHEPRSVFGYFQALTNNFIHAEGLIQYGRQEIFFYDNVAAQIQQQIHCSTENINNNLIVVYAGITAGVPGPIYPSIDVVSITPPYLPRVPLDEMWIKTEGGAEIAVWFEYMPIDFLCDTARNNFAPRDSDKSPDKNLPNPSGQGNEGQPEGGQDVSGIPSPPTNGDGQGTEDPFLVPGTVWRIRVNGSGQNAFCESFSGEFYNFGPFTSKPTIDFPKDGTKGDGTVRCGFTNERHVRVVVNGVDQGGANALGLVLNPIIEKRVGGVGPWVPA